MNTEVPTLRNIIEKGVIELAQHGSARQCPTVPENA